MKILWLRTAGFTNRKQNRNYGEGREKVLICFVCWSHRSWLPLHINSLTYLDWRRKWWFFGWVTIYSRFFLSFLAGRRGIMQRKNVMPHIYALFVCNVLLLLFSSIALCIEREERGWWSHAILNVYICMCIFG